MIRVISEKALATQFYKHLKSSNETLLVIPPTSETSLNCVVPQSRELLDPLKSFSQHEHETQEVRFPHPAKLLAVGSNVLPFRPSYRDLVPQQWHWELSAKPFVSHKNSSFIENKT